MISSLIVTVVGPDRPGIVNAISDKATILGANWAESRMASLAGRFVGIVHLQVPTAKVDALITALHELELLDLNVTVTSSGDTTAEGSRVMNVELIGQDRPGIVRDISRVLAARSISIEELDTEFVSGSCSGENLFQANAKLRVPAIVALDELRHVLEALANELMVDVTLDNGNSHNK